MLHSVEPDRVQKAVLVAVIRPRVTRWDVEESLRELGDLAVSAGMEVAGHLIQERRRIDSAFFIGKGKLDELSDAVKASEAELVIFDDDLTPAQARNLMERLDVRVLDRTGLILDLFAGRARTRAAQIQVELAGLRYLLPRLTRQWTHLSRQTGGTGAAGGLGRRGPGETQLQADRRQVKKRIFGLSRSLESVEKQRKVERLARAGMFRVALVGYTNAGKSTLLNALAQSDALVEDKLFATLDPLTRVIALDQGRPALLTDTVGFIRKLPHDLIASFHSTLEEAVEADLLLHVVDVSHPRCEDHIQVANEVLHDLGILDTPTLLVFNKTDLLAEQGVLCRLCAQYPNGVGLSATTGEGMDALRGKILEAQEQEWVTVALRIPMGKAGLVSQLYRLGSVLEQTYDESGVSVRAKLKKSDARRMAALIGG